MEIYIDIHKKLNEFDLDVQFESSGTMGLLGPSGCGKSMTLRSIAGIETPDMGIIKINGKTVFDSAKRINLPPQKRNIGFVFQNYALFPHMTVFENIQFGMKYIDKEDRVKDIAEKVEITNLLNRYPRELSGGQQQRVAIARALSKEPNALLLDEPFSALDTYLKMQLEEWLEDLIKDFNGPVLFVSHNIGEISRICNNVTMLSSGSVIESGSMEEVLYNPKSLETAIISGCRNISKASSYDDGNIEAVNWNTVLNIDRPISGEVPYLGVYSTDILIAKKSVNSITCQVKKVKDRMGIVDLHLLPYGGDKLIHVELTRREFENIHLSDSMDIYIPPDKIMLLK